MLCCSLQGRRSSQRLGVHGGEDAVEARQRPGLHALHPKGSNKKAAFIKEIFYPRLNLCEGDKTASLFKKPHVKEDILI